VEPQYSGWSGKDFDKRQYETLHKVIYFDLVANRGIPGFALTWEGGYSPGSIHSAGQLHAFMNEVAPVISKRDYLADIGLAASSWSQIAAQPLFGGWQDQVTKRYFSEFLGWSQYLASARDFPQWDVVPFDDVTLDDLARFKLIILPSILVVTADHFAVLEAYLNRGGKLLVTGETGTFAGPKMLLMPRPKSAIAGLAERFPDQVTVTKDKPGLTHHLQRANATAMRELLQTSGAFEPVLAATGAPDHIGIYLNASRTRPGEITLDLVNYQYDLGKDQITPVTAPEFRVELRLKQFAPAARLFVEAVRYDESAPNHVARQTLSRADITVESGKLILRVPNFDHYQLIRIAPQQP
jgi:hypothetical protein